MPYAIRRRGSKYEVVNTDTGDGHGATSRGKAEKQLTILRGIDRNWKATGGGNYTRTINGRKINLKVVGGKSRGKTK